MVWCSSKNIFTTETPRAQRSCFLQDREIRRRQGYGGTGVDPAKDRSPAGRHQNRFRHYLFGSSPESVGEYD